MTGDLFITIDGIEYDAYEKYGASLEPSAMAELMTPPPLKEFVSSKSRLKSGKRSIVSNPVYDERSVSLPLHINAKSVESFLTRYNDFCNEVLSKGKFIVRTRYNPDVYYRLIYQSCSQYSEFRMEYAAFTLKCDEPDPSNRGATDNNA